MKTIPPCTSNLFRRETQHRKDTHMSSPCPFTLRADDAQLAQLENDNAESAWLDAEEEARRLEKRLAGEKESLRKLKLFCQSKTQEEIAFREEAVSR